MKRNTLIFFSLLLSLLLIANLCSNAQSEVTTSDGKILKFVSDWSPALIKDSVSSFRRKGSLYILLEGKDSTEYVYTITRKLYVPPVVTVKVNIDDRDPAVKYTGTWIKQAASTAFNSTISFSGTTGNTAKLDFTGKSITLVAENRPFHGKAGITIDSGPEEIIDMYSPTNKDQVQVLKKTFTDGQHSITVRITGTRNVASTGNFVVIDQFIVER